MIYMWILLIFVPNEAAGRQIGPFQTKELCIVAEQIYNNAQRRFSAPQSKCIQLS